MAESSNSWLIAERAAGVNTFTGSFVSQAAFNGCIAFTNWPRSDVEKLLPSELKLDTRTGDHARHPVAFIFGDLVDGATMFGGLTFRTGIAYQEFAMAVPFVTHPWSDALHVYIPRMYSSFFPPTWSGNTYYGFAKQLAEMRWQGPVFVIAGEGQTLLLHAAVDATSDWHGGVSCDLPGFDAIQAVFSLPMVGRKADGVYVCSYFGWDFTAAQIRSADALISIDAPLVEGIMPGEHHDIPSGTFEVRDMVWRLSWPLACSEVD